MSPRKLRASLALALIAPWSATVAAPDAVTTPAARPGAASTASPDDLVALREELRLLRADHEARVRALEARLQAAEARIAQAATALPPLLPPAAAPAQPPAARSADNAHNPAISLILSGGYTRTSQDPARYAISGFLLPQGAEAGPGERGLHLAESELGLSASIDPWTRGVAHVALHPDEIVSVEEAYVQTTALGNGLGLKVGRFLSGIGYLNEQHSHAWDFADNPLAYQALLGTQFGDDGAQLRWLAPGDRYLELGLELGRGRTYPGSNSPRNGPGMLALTAHAGDDIGDSHNWRAGLSVLSARATDQLLDGLDAGGAPLVHRFSGRTRVWVADAVWKWAPHGNASRTSLKLQGEYLRSERRGDLVADLDGAASADTLRAVQSGWYLQGVWQFMPGWRLGLRTERLDTGTLDAGSNTALLAAGAGYRPSRTSLMVDLNASEFSRVRLQWAQDRSRQGVVDHQIFLQYQMSLGAHGAHGY